MCENQGKQCELIDHWKSVKTFLKKKHGMTQKRQKEFTSYKIRYKS